MLVAIDHNAAQITPPKNNMVTARFIIAIYAYVHKTWQLPCRYRPLGPATRRCFLCTQIIPSALYSSAQFLKIATATQLAHTIIKPYCGRKAFFRLGHHFPPDCFCCRARKAVLAPLLLVAGGFQKAVTVATCHYDTGERFARNAIFSG